MKLDDQGLLLQLAHNLDSAFPHLVRQYQNQLYTFAFRLAGNAHDAEEIAQDAFIRIYYALKTYSKQRVLEIKLRPWLYTIVRNVFLSSKRKQAVPIVSLDESEESPFVTLVDENCVLPENEAEKEEVRRVFSQLIATLPARYREAITLYYFEDFSYYEIAELLHQPVGTVKSNVHRGVRLLRQMPGTTSIK